MTQAHIDWLYTSQSGGKHALIPIGMQDTPGIAQDVWVGGSTRLDLCNAVSHHSVPVLVCQWHNMQLHACILAYLHQPLHIHSEERSTKQFAPETWLAMSISFTAPDVLFASKAGC